jgi:iron complex outermembrane receptor protein
MTPRHFNAYLVSCSLLVIAVAAQPAYAQAGPAAQDTTADMAPDIIVTANKRNQNINDVGLSITALSGAALTQKGITSSLDLQKVVPALTVASAADGTPVYTLRGVGFNSSNLGAQPTVSVYNDQAALPYGPMTQGPLFDLERLEVLKGPQGTLFGQNSTGGAINYIANKPTDKFEAGATIGYSRFNTFQGEAFVSGPISNTLSARLAVAGTRSGDWQYNYTRNDSIGKQKKIAARFLLDWHPTDRLSVSLNLNGWIDRSDNQIPQFLIPFPRVASQAIPQLFTQPAAPRNDRAANWDANRPFNRDNKMGQAILRIDYKATDQLTLTSLTNYEYVRIRSIFDNDGTQFGFGYVTTSGHVEAFNQEFRATGQFGHANVTVGANYSTDNSYESSLQSYNGVQSSTINVGATPANPTGAGTLLFNENRGRQTNNSASVFGNVEYEIVPQLTVIGGVRYTDLRHTNQACSADVDGTFSAVINNLFGAPLTQRGGCITLDSATFTAPFPVQHFVESNVSWRAGVNYKPTKDILVYGLVSRGYKAGNYPVINATVRSQLQPVRQEELTDYEAGVKLGLFDGRLQLNFSGYYYDYRDKQLLTNTADPIFGLLPVLANVPKSTVKGFDFDTTIRPFTGLTIHGAVAYAKSKIKDFQGFDAFNTPTDLSGKSFNFSPKWTSTADIEYRRPLSNAIDIFVGGDMAYNSTTYADLAQTPSLQIAPYTIYGLHAGIASSDGRRSATIWARNITNKYYWYNVQVGYDTIWRLTGMPATYGVTATFKM